MKSLALLLLLAGTAHSQGLVYNYGYDNKCTGVDISSSVATAVFDSTTAARGDGYFIYKSTGAWAWVDVQNSTNSANLFCNYNIMGYAVSAASASLNSIPSIATLTTSNSTRGWRIAAGSNYLFRVVPGRVVLCKNDSNLQTTGATVCVGR